MLLSYRGIQYPQNRLLLLGDGSLSAGIGTNVAVRILSSIIKSIDKLCPPNIR